jgi:hypothetical protein
LPDRRAAGVELPGRLRELRDGRKVYVIPARTIAPFTLAMPRPAAGPWLPVIEAALAADGPVPVRWAIIAVAGETLLIEGARVCSPPSS